eukprot:GABV01008860.1.p1 GENE.GABV01008860.1~~GABV01008860.1.p1  ORF type:complete len:258 (+),score=43.70 GABV01008860.1:108-881(+)
MSAPVSEPGDGGRIAAGILSTVVAFGQALIWTKFGSQVREKFDGVLSRFSPEKFTTIFIGLSSVLAILVTIGVFAPFYSVNGADSLALWSDWGSVPSAIGFQRFFGIFSFFFAWAIPILAWTSSHNTPLPPCKNKCTPVVQLDWVFWLEFLLNVFLLYVWTIGAGYADDHDAESAFEVKPAGAFVVCLICWIITLPLAPCVDWIIRQRQIGTTFGDDDKFGGPDGDYHVGSGPVGATGATDAPSYDEAYGGNIAVVS